MQEEWRDVVGYEGYYQVSNFGNIRSIRFNKIRQIRPAEKSNGYFHVSLCVDRKSKICLVHRLVAKAFIENPNNYPSINHKDENKSNNNMNNLEWCTDSYNCLYGNRNKKISNKIYKPIIQLKDGIEIKRFVSAKHIKEELGYNPSAISNSIYGKLKNAYGFEWKFVNEVDYVKKKI